MTICVGAMLLDRRRVLLGMRSAHGSYPGCWDILGGHVEAGETPEAALSRELNEEVGVTPLEWRHLATIEFKEDATAAELRVYEVSRWEGEPSLRNDEHVELKWWALKDACELDRLAAVEYIEIFAQLAE